ncbi:ComF family protein [Corynebacterium confusum]
MGVWRQVGELLVPRACAGCQAPGQVLCAACREHLRTPPHRVARRTLLDPPIFALGPYSEIRRNLIIQMKEYHNQAVRPYVGAVIAAGLEQLVAQGVLPPRLVVVPAPTRASSARARGGDPVLHICQHAARLLGDGLPLTVVNCARLRRGVADQSRLNADLRWANMRDAVAVDADPRLVGRATVVVDDVVTTGATLINTADKLRAAGALVRAGLVLADA